MNNNLNPPFQQIPRLIRTRQGSEPNISQTPARKPSDSLGKTIKTSKSRLMMQLQAEMNPIEREVAFEREMNLTLSDSALNNHDQGVVQGPPFMPPALLFNDPSAYFSQSSRLNPENSSRLRVEMMGYDQLYGSPVGSGLKVKRKLSYDSSTQESPRPFKSGRLGSPYMIPMRKNLVATSPFQTATQQGQDTLMYEGSPRPIAPLSPRYHTKVHSVPNQKFNVQNSPRLGLELNMSGAGQDFSKMSL